MHLFNEKKSTILNKIITNFAHLAEASISRSIENELGRYQSGLDRFDENTRLQVRRMLEDAHRKKIEEKIKSHDSYGGIKFKLNKENLEYLTRECPEDKNMIYQGNGRAVIGKYLKALFEEYCERSYLERERIIYADRFDTIETAIKNGEQLKALLRDDPKMGSAKYVHIKPYKIVTDPLSMYHYLAGYLSSPKEKPDESFSYRISGFKDIKRLKERSFIKKESRTRLEEEIRENGPQFLCGNLAEFKIRLTDEGIAKYNRLLHLRPQYASIDQSKKIYTFRCTEQQIEYYFFKFGADAFIMSPKSLRVKFGDMYRNALGAYEPQTDSARSDA